jgi:hypothetical protein
MTNDDMRIILERGLGIPVAESDAAWILACVEGKLRNENSAQQSVHPTKATPRWFEVLVNKFMALCSRLRG